MPSVHATLPPELGSTVFTTGQARGAGVNRHRLRSSDLTVVGRGLRHRRGTDTKVTEYLHALQDLYPQAVFSHGTAAYLWGIWLPRNVETINPVHLSITAGRGTPARRKHVKGHALSHAAPVVEVDGLRVTSAAWTWTDLASEITALPRLVAAGDSLLQRSDGPTARRSQLSHPLATVEELRAVATRRKNVKGIRLARTALEHVRPRVDSPKETETRLMVVAAGFPEPALNPRLVLSDGSTMHPDLAWLDLRICIQYEGEHHWSDRAQFDADIQRDRRLRAEGWVVLRVSRSIFWEGREAFLGDLRAAFTQRGR